MVVRSFLSGNISPMRSPESTTTKARFLPPRIRSMASGSRRIVDFDIFESRCYQAPACVATGRGPTRVSELPGHATAPSNAARHEAPQWPPGSVGRIVAASRAVTTLSRDRRSLAAGASTGRAFFRFGLTGALLVALAPRPLRAEPIASPDAEEPATDPAQDEQIERAMAAYQRGTNNYNLALYEAALADFTEAASLYASPDFQYNIGLCYEKLDKYDDAIRAFATYLRAKPDAEDRPDVENRIHELEQASNERKRQAEEDRKAREAGRARSDEPTPPPVQPIVDEPPPTDDGRPLIIAGAALAGVGVALGLGGGIGLGVPARSRSEAVDAVLTGGNPDGLTYSQAQALDSEGKRFEAIQIGLAAGGAAVAVTGAVLLAVGLRKRQAGRVQAWRVRPLHVQSSSTTGLVLTGRF